MNLTKTYCLLIFCLAGVLSLSAQNLSWTDSSNEWRYDYFRAGINGNTSYVTLNLLEETVDIGERKCFVLRPTDPAGFTSGEDIIFWEDEAGAIYRYADSSFSLLYDFSLEVGDTYEVYLPYYANNANPNPTLTLRVDTVTTKIIEGTPIRAQYVSPVGAPINSFEGWNYEFFGNIDFYFVPIDPMDCEGACPAGQRCFSSTEQGFEVNFTGLPCDFISSIDQRLPDVSAELRVYPNPVGRTQEVLLELPVDLATRESELQLINHLGQPVYQRIIPQGVRANRLELPALPGGVYYLLWQSEEARATKKVVLVR